MDGYALTSANMDPATAAARRQILDAPMSQAADWRSLGRAALNTAPRAAEPAFGAVARGMAVRALPYAVRGLSLAAIPEQAAAFAGDQIGTAAYNHMPQSWQNSVIDNVGGAINRGMRATGLGGIDDSAYDAQRSSAPYFGNVQSGASNVQPDSYTAALQGEQARLQNQYNARYSGNGMSRRFNNGVMVR